MAERIILLTVLFTLSALFSLRHRLTKRQLNTQLPAKYHNQNSLPTILYFWTDLCVQCKTLQKPALNSLQIKNSKFNLVSVNALNEIDLISLFKIKTVPSTVIFSADGTSRFIYNGFIDENNLSKQIETSMN
jgi:thioredoxin-like negative regulator of GroEL